MKTNDEKQDDRRDKIAQKIITSNENNTQVELSTVFRFLFFLVFIFFSIVIHCENFVRIKYKLDLDIKSSVICRTISYFFISFFPIEYINKITTLLSILLKTIIIYFPIQNYMKNIYIVYGYYFLNNATNFFFYIFFRIWVDQLAQKKIKSTILYFYNITPIISTIIIDLISQSDKIYINSSNLFILSYIFGLTLIIFLFFPSNYFHISGEFIYHKKITRKYSTISDEELDYDSMSLFNFEDNEEKEDDGKIIYDSFFSIFMIPAYIFSVYAKTCLIFMMEMISIYINELIKRENNFKNIKNLISIFGALFGGILSIFIGNYEQKYSCLIVAIFGSIDLIIIFLSSYVTNSEFWFCLYIYIFYFITYSYSSIIIGYISSSLRIKIKIFGLAICELFSLYLGNIVPKKIYYSIKNIFDGNNFYSWKFSCFYFLAGYFSILLACTFTYRDINRKEIKMNKKKEKMKNLEDDKEIELKCLGPSNNV